MTKPEFKFCQACGRRIEWRAKWAGCWGRMRYCGEACRRQRLDATDRALEEAILGLLACRHVGDTICPSEAVCLVVGSADRQSLDQRSRWAARRLVNRGQLELVQEDRVVDPSTFRGPIRLRLPRGINAIRHAA
jgi:hypothetical protein